MIRRGWLLLVVAALSSCGWAQFRGDSQHSGTNAFEHSIGVSNVASLAPAWTNAHQDLGNQEVVIRGGRAFIGSPVRFYAIDSGTGQDDWHIDRVKGTFGPATTDGPGTDGTVYAGETWSIVTTHPQAADASGITHVLDAETGSELSTINEAGAPPVFATGWRYIAVNHYNLGFLKETYRLDATSGTDSFSVDVSAGPTEGTGIGDVVTDGTQVFFTTNAHLAAVPVHGCGAPLCSPTWHSASTDPAFQSLVAGSTTVFANTGTGVYAYAKQGCGATTCSPLWHTPPPQLGYPVLVALAGNRLYVTRGPTLEAYSASGCGAATCSPLWTAAISLGASGQTSSGPSVANGVVYVGAADGTLFAWNAAGCGTAVCAPLLASTQGGAVGPVTVNDGALYFTVDGALRKLVLPN